MACPTSAILRTDSGFFHFPFGCQGLLFWAAGHLETRFGVVIWIVAKWPQVSSRPAKTVLSEKESKYFLYYPMSADSKHESREKKEKPASDARFPFITLFLCLNSEGNCLTNPCGFPLETTPKWSSVQGLANSRTRLWNQALLADWHQSDLFCMLLASVQFYRYNFYYMKSSEKRQTTAFGFSDRDVEPSAQETGLMDCVHSPPVCPRTNHLIILPSTFHLYWWLFSHKSIMFWGNCLKYLYHIGLRSEGLQFPFFTFFFLSGSQKKKEKRG